MLSSQEYTKDASEQINIYINDETCRFYYQSLRLAKLHPPPCMCTSLNDIGGTIPPSFSAIFSLSKTILVLQYRQEKQRT